MSWAQEYPRRAAAIAAAGLVLFLFAAMIGGALAGGGKSTASPVVAKDPSVGKQLKDLAATRATLVSTQQQLGYETKRAALWRSRAIAARHPNRKHR